MNCSEVLELISYAVDNQLSEPKRSEFNQHIEVCPTCRRKFVFEQSTKSFVHAAFHTFIPPEELKRKIYNQITQSDVLIDFSISEIPSKKRIPKYLYVILPILLVVILLIIIPKKSHKHIVNLPENNLIRLMYQKFDQALNGNQEYFIQTSDLVNLKMTLADQIGEEINFPRLNNSKLIGGWVSNEYGNRLIHTIYKNDDGIICCTQINFNELVNDKKIFLDQEVIDKLRSGGKYICNDFKCCSMIMWLEAKYLCVATAETDTGTLMAYLIK